MRLVVLFAALIVATDACATSASGVARGTSSTPPNSGVGCLDTLRAVDTVTAVIKLTIKPQDSSGTIPADLDNIFAEELKANFTPPKALPLGVVSGLEPCDSSGTRCAGGVLDLSASAYLTAHSNGRFSRIAVVDASLTPSLAEALRTALQKASDARTTGWAGEPDSISLELHLVAETRPDSVPRLRQLFKSIVPRYSLPFSAATMPRSGVGARYPLTAELAGIEDTVIVAFTVDSDGSIAPESMEMLSAKYRDFVASVATALLSTRYHPARLGDCAVATRLRQRFVFTTPH